MHPFLSLDDYPDPSNWSKSVKEFTPVRILRKAQISW